MASHPGIFTVSATSGRVGAGLECEALASPSGYTVFAAATASVSGLNMKHLPRRRAALRLLCGGSFVGSVPTCFWW